jgi:regulator of cell morphogenesis and NO signaling
MTTATLPTVREIALEQPSAIRVFERFGIDYCCGGRKPLTEACSSLNLEIREVTAALAAAAESPATVEIDWTRASLTGLSEHITLTHHAYVRRELPRLAVLAQKVVNRHGDTKPELPAIQGLLAHLDAELTQHLAKEEAILFPYVVRLEAAALTQTAKPEGCFATVASPIAMMTQEHEAAGALLAEMRRLSQNYTAPEGACPTYLAYYQCLHEFERDLHQHIHLENNILFPRAIELEARMSDTSAAA